MDIKKITSVELLQSLDTLLDNQLNPTVITRKGIPQVVLVNYSSFSNILSYLKELKSFIEGKPQSIDKNTFDEYIVTICNATRRLQDIESAYLDLLISIATAIETNQSYLYGHNERVAIFSCEVARQMHCTEDEIEHIRLASILQNIGEIGIPTYVLQKKTNLESDDWDLIKEHPKISAEIIGKIKKLEPVVPIIYSHHEKYDGTGYPDGIKGEDIPLGSRIISIADTYDAMTNVRLHRNASNHFDAIEEIRKLSGINFDPKIVDIFASIF